MDKPNFNPKELRLTAHAKEQLNERFKLSNEKQALNFCKDLIVKGQYIGVLPDIETGRKAHFYTHNKIGIYVSYECTAVVTVMEMESYGHYGTLKNKVIDLYFKEFRKWDRIENSAERKIEGLQLECDYKIAELKYKKFKTRSKNVELECDNEIIKINTYLESKVKELEKIRIEKKKIARAMATMVF